MKKWIFIVFISVLFISCTSRPNLFIEDKPCLEPDTDYKFSLCRPMRVIINGQKIIIPERFKTDLASVPRFLWSFYSPTKTETIAPAVMHDYFYNCPNPYTRMEADKFFYFALVDNGLHKARAYIYWLGVRLFGASSYEPIGPCPHVY